jgi:hypothetical protein
MKPTPLRFDFCPASLALSAAAFAALLIAAFPAHAASWEGTHDFSSGISPIDWAVHQANAGQMTVEGANGHSSFLVPPSTTALQNAYLVSPGTPTAAEDWMVEITGHNAAGYSLNGDSQLQLAVYHTTSIGYRIAMVVEKAAGGALMFNVKHRISCADSSVFHADALATVYYLIGTPGWGPTYAGRPTAPWMLPYPVILGNTSSFGVQTNAFGFFISSASNATVVVDASTTITSPIWSPVTTNTLVHGTSYFSDPDWANYPTRFCRVRSL